MARVQSSLSTEAAIPTASMPDIIFMLLIFFMAATTIRQYDGIPVRIPEARTTQKIEVAKIDITYIWVDKNDRIMIDDQFVPYNEIETLNGILYDRRVANPRTVISMKADSECRMKIINDVQQECRKAYTLRVNYNTRFAN